MYVVYITLLYTLSALSVNPGLILNKAASDEIIWHCKHYTGRGVMKFYESGEALCKDMNISLGTLEAGHEK
jgi:hypothetical protein